MSARTIERISSSIYSQRSSTSQWPSTSINTLNHKLHVRFTSASCLAQYLQYGLPRNNYRVHSCRFPWYTPQIRSKGLHNTRRPLDTFDGPTDPLSPLPTDFPGWRKAMEKSLTLCHATETGLDAYTQALSLDRHPDLTPRFKNQEIRRVDITIKTLNITRIRVEGIIKKMDRFLLDECNDPSTTQPQVSDYVMGWDEEFREYVAKARAYLVSAHAFYKVNYALCPVVKS